MCVCVCVCVCPIEAVLDAMKNWTKFAGRKCRKESDVIIALMAV